jgi:predicted PurR-regulated permease PerM
LSQNWLVTAFFFALLSVILYGAFLILSPFLTAITWAAILAVLTYPAYAWVLKLLRGRATPAALILIVAITLILIMPGVELAWFLSQEAVALVKTVRALLSEEGVAEWTQKPWVQEALRWWSLVSFRLLDFEIDWKENAVRAPASSSFLVSQVGRRAERSGLRG